MAWATAWRSAKTVSKQPLVRRIVIAFVLMTLAVSGTFSLGIVAIVHFIEEHLVSQEMASQLNIVLDEDVGLGRPPRLDTTTRFYSSAQPEYAVPAPFDQVPEGFSEWIDGDQAYYVFKRRDDGHDYLLVQDQQEFEDREQALFDVVLAGFVFSLLAAWALGWLVARRVIAPVVRLAGQVRHRDQLLPLAPALAPEYPDDEVGALAAAFDATLGQLRHSLERERLFTSDVSHELRTPLMIIASSCELLAEPGRLPPRERDQVTRIARACEEMSDLVRTFLVLARPGPGDTSQGGRVALADVAEEQVRRWAPAFAQKGLRLELRAEAADTGAYNLTCLRTVISNLLRNALHYTEEGAAELVLERGGLRVEDTGIGIPPEQQARMFLPFVRGEQARGEGLGLGLSLVKRICAHEGWRVWVETREPRGSVFVVRFDAGA